MNRYTVTYQEEERRPLDLARARIEDAARADREEWEADYTGGGTALYYKGRADGMKHALMILDEEVAQ